MSILAKPFMKIMKSEGGYNPKEPKSIGGYSYAGIGQKTYESWLKNKCQIADAPKDVKELAGKAIGTEYEKMSPLDIPKEYGVRVDVIKAFYEAYFQPACVDMLPQCLQYMHMDFFVNSYSHANKIVQRILEVDVDGVLGRGSKAKLKEFTANFEAELKNNKYADNDLIEKYHELKLAHYESIKGTNPDLYNENIKGWKLRANHVLADLQEYFEDDEPTTSAIHEDEFIDPFVENDNEPEKIVEKTQDLSDIVDRQDKLEKSVENIQDMLKQLLEEKAKPLKKNGFFS